ncbi:TonB-dependent receptor [Horticoccus sp. 23ND18S-11]|uniref:TonB-dependent receptor n=1 Tax=Horticoccus sp. 23ND18S-11 TaxID=3391832 RepID=UPI0039C923FC
MSFLACAESMAATLQGTVVNQNTKRFLERATVQLQGTPYQTLTDKDGGFRLPGLPAGTYTVVVNYSGLDEATQTVTLTADQTLSSEFGLTAKEVYTLDKFVVNTAIEGTAYAINQQRRAETARSVTSIDAFIDQTTGNPGEFLKNVEGIQMDYSNNEPQSIRIRGIDPNLTMVTMDGNEVASAASSGANRNVQIDQLSIASIDSVEVFKANIPSMSANAIGGAVNFNTKSAFSQKGRRAFLQVGVNMDSNDFNLDKTPGPGNGTVAERRVYPVYRFEYSDSFLRNRVGVVFSFGHDLTNQLGSSAAQSLGTPTALPGQTLPAPPTLYTLSNVAVQRSGLNIAPNRQLRLRDDVSLNTDFKFSDSTTLFLKSTLTKYKSTNRNHQLNLSTGAFAPGSNVASYTTTGATASQSISVFDKYTYSWQINPGLKYRAGNWKVDLVGGLSKSINHYRNPNNFGGLSTSLTGIGYSLTTPLNHIQPSSLVQNSGADFYDLNSYAPSQGNLLANREHRAGDAGFVSNNNRNTANTKWSGRLDVQRDFQGSIPFYLKAGLAYNDTVFNKHQDQQRWYWMGDDGVASADDTTAAGARLGRFAEPVPVTMQIPGWNIREPVYFSPNVLYSYWRANPQVLQENLAYAAQQAVQGRQYVNEKISAGYVMGVFDFKRLNVLAGLRSEKTDIKAIGFRVLPTSGPNSVLPPGVNATSLAGILATYRAQKTSSKYTSDPFPYLHLKYEWLPGLQTRVSYTEGIGRPNLSAVLPSLQQDDTNRIINSNRAGLLPQRSKNLDASIEYYTRTAGQWTATWFSRDIKDYITSQTVAMTPALLTELSLGQEFASYQLTTQQNIGSAKWSGYELSFRQSLREWAFIPKSLHGVSVWANYTKVAKMEGDFGSAAIAAGTSPKITQLANTVPQLANAGISYRTPNGKLFVHLSQNYMAPKTTVNLPAVNAAAQLAPRLESYRFWNLEASYRLTDKIRLTGTGRNLGSERQRTTQMGVVNNEAQHTGIAWLFAAKYDL